jgi:hypothetical protein
VAAGGYLEVFFDDGAMPADLMPRFLPIWRPENRKDRRQAGNRLPAPENGDVLGSRKVCQAMATFDYNWWVEGTEPPRYLDLDARLTKFQELVNEALSREQLDVQTVPVTLMLA